MPRNYQKKRIDDKLPPFPNRPSLISTAFTNADYFLLFEKNLGAVYQRLGLPFTDLASVDWIELSLSLLRAHEPEFKRPKSASAKTIKLAKEKSARAELLAIFEAAAAKTPGTTRRKFCQKFAMSTCRKKWPSHYQTKRGVKYGTFMDHLADAIKERDQSVRQALIRELIRRSAPSGLFGLTGIPSETGKPS